MLEYVPQQDCDILFASGVLHYFLPDRRSAILQEYQRRVRLGVLGALHVFVWKPFMPTLPDEDIDGGYQRSGQASCFRSLLIENFTAQRDAL